MVSTNLLATVTAAQETNSAVSTSAPPALTVSALEPIASNQPTALAPTDSPTSKLEAAATKERYLVKRGDTLLGIAKAHHTTVDAIKTANGLATDRIIAGKELKLPAAPTSSTASPTSRIVAMSFCEPRSW